MTLNPSKTLKIQLWALCAHPLGLYEKKPGLDGLMELECGISFGSLIFQIDCTRFLYSSSMFASSIILVVARSMVSIPKSLMTQIFPLKVMVLLLPECIFQCTLAWVLICLASDLKHQRL